VVENRAGRPSSDRLALSGRAASGVAEYRSDFCHAWVLGGEIEGDELAAALGDLELAACAAHAEGARPATPGGLIEAGPPPAVRQFLHGFDFLRTHLWAPAADDARVAVIGMCQAEGRLWVFRAGAEAVLEQLTGAPGPFLWHAVSDGGLEWGEAAVSEVWRLECPGPAGALAIHHRPPLVSVLGTLREEAEADSSTPLAATNTETAPAPRRPRPAAVVSLRPRRPRLVGTSLVQGLVAVLAMIAVAIAFVALREPVARAISGRYELALTTQPAGATLRVDGEAVAGRTPLTIPLGPGEHRVELTIGEYANAVFTVDGERGETIEKSIAWTGSLAIASADTTAKVNVTFDGKSWGAVPLWRDDVPVGRHRVSFQGEGLRSWEEEVKIKAGESTRLTIEPERVPSFGMVTARAERVTSGGVEDVDGAQVYLDGRAAGTTPVELKLKPGPHSIRIVTGGEQGPVHHVDVQPGGRYYASSTFGRPAEPRVALASPASISLAAPPTLVAHLESGVPLPVRRMRLFLRPAGAAEWTAHDLALALDGSRARGMVAWPTTGLTAGKSVASYVEIETREGEEYFSEVTETPVRP
jgi:hypothetical protein